ncbi:hypothetical protein G9A89_000782 [Geosiphon pyriformis]|nr:hypothetical protein G9A89_000782 [Geosiphon pyriformis]
MCLIAGVTNTLASCKLSLSGFLPNVFWAGSGVTVADILGLDQYLSVIDSLKRFGLVFANQLLDHYDNLLVNFIENSGLVYDCVLASGLIPSHCLNEVNSVGRHFLEYESDLFVVYTDSLIKNFGTVNAHGGTAAYFLDIDKSVGVGVHDLLSLTLAEL